MLQKFFAFLLFVCGSAFLPSQALAAEKFDIPPGEDWVHPHSGIIFPARADGIGRIAAISFADDFLDVGLAYETADGGEAISLYVFRNTNGAVPVWLEQGRVAIETRDVFEGLAVAIQPQSFAPAGSATRAGLRVVYGGNENASFRSTGIAIFAAGEWYVKLRVSSSTMAPEALAERMAIIMDQVIVPETLEFGPEAFPVSECAESLNLLPFSADAPTGTVQAMESGIILSAGFDGEVGDGEAFGLFGRDVGHWCREEAFGGAQAVYRPMDTSDRYLFTIGDNGRGVWVGPELGLNVVDEERAPAFTIVSLTADSATVFPAQTGLPSYERLAEVVNSGRFLVDVGTWGRERSITVNSSVVEPAD